MFRFVTLKYSVQEDVDETAFHALDRSLINELIPQIGLRAKFIAKYQQWTQMKTFSETAASLENLPEETFGSTSSTVILENIDSPNSSVAGGSHCGFDRPLAFSSPSSVESNRSSQELKPNVDVKSVTCVGKNFSLADVLNESVSGQLVLAKYKENHKLDSSSRKRLSEVVVNHLITEVKEKKIKISNSDFSHISTEISHLFPGEVAGTYYVAPQSEGPTQLVSRGKIVDRYRNQVATLRRAGVIPNDRKKKK